MTSGESDRARAGYGQFIMTALSQTVGLLLRRRRTVLAILVGFLPVLIPLASSLLSSAPVSPEGITFFVAIAEKLFLIGVVPMFALFFGCMLVGEDVELHTIHYILTRPVPRSAWVIGKFLAYLIVASLIVLPALALTFAACTALGTFAFTASNLRLLLHYSGVMVMALAAYGSLAMLLGAFFKRPVIYGVLFLFGWQRIAILVPGVIDFITIEKYLKLLLPPLAVQRDNPVLRTALMEFQKQEFVIGAYKAVAVLVVATVVFLVLTSVIVRHREYTAARAAGS